MRAALVLLGAAVLASAAPQWQYYLANQGESCAAYCNRNGMNCNPRILTNDSPNVFAQLGATCEAKADTAVWWSHDQPSVAVDPADKNYGRCLGFQNVPGGVFCGASYPAVRRLCRCDKPHADEVNFGYGVSNGWATKEEVIVYQHWLAKPAAAAMTHMWLTIPNNHEGDLMIRYYVDGEKTASVAYQPGLACGVGFNDVSGPWGTQWIGKGAKHGAWFNNIRIPFARNVIVTVQHANIVTQGFYMLLRGSLNTPVVVGGITLPDSAKLKLYVTKKHMQPFEYITFANVSSGPGAMFLHTLAVDSGNIRFMEGCYHVYDRTVTNEFPGIVVATGCEDYFDSAWYFDGGVFRHPNAGFTHVDTDGGRYRFSAYRFHDNDPLIFKDGFRFDWRNGETVDITGVKCMMEGKGRIIDQALESDVISYVWVYTW